MTPKRKPDASAPMRARLRELGFLKPNAREKTLRALCHAGKLHGGLTISLRATPDEVWGQLVGALGGTAAGMKLEDVRGKGPFELHVRTQHGLERWEVEGLAGLVRNLNSLFEADPSVKEGVVLGEWEDALQVWCVDRLRRMLLTDEPWFRPEVG